MRDVEKNRFKSSHAQWIKHDESTNLKTSLIRSLLESFVKCLNELSANLLFNLSQLLAAINQLRFGTEWTKLSAIIRYTSWFRSVWPFWIVQFLICSTWKIFLWRLFFREMNAFDIWNTILEMLNEAWKFNMGKKRKRTKINYHSHGKGHVLSIELIQVTNNGTSNKTS